MWKKNFSILMVMLISLTGMVYGNILLVPTNYSSIQSAINASQTGDTVLVEPGTYYENINLSGQNIVLCSRFLLTGNPAYIDSTILDGNHSGRVLTINNGEDSTCLITGFSIRNGDASFEFYVTYGGGVYIENSSPVIRNCVIENNYAPAYGGGLSITGYNAAPRVNHCTIRNNSADSFGGGLFMGDCHANAVVENCIITSNSITCYCSSSGGGAGVNLYHTGRLVNCLITNNTAPNSYSTGGGVHCDWGNCYGYQGIYVTGCTISGNSAYYGGGVGYVINGGEFRNCIIWGNTDHDGNPSNYDGNTLQYCNSSPLPSGAGNISAEPAFRNAANGDFHLLSSSPCINAGSNSLSFGDTDLDGNPRIDGVVDMGVYEYGSMTGTTVQVGSGTDVIYNFPVNTCNNYNYSQQIYLAGELNQGGNVAGYITKIKFRYFSNGGNGDLWNQWNVYLGNTNRDAFLNSSDWVPLSELTQVFHGTLATVTDSAWIEIFLDVPFFYSGGNLVVAVDENVSGYYCSAEWGGYYADGPRGLSFSSYYDNPDPASPPPANSGPDNWISQFQMFIADQISFVEGVVTRQPACSDPVPGAVVSDNVYFSVTDSTGYYKLFIQGGRFANLSATDGNVTQTLSNIYIQPNDTTQGNFCLPIYFPPPVMLEAAVTGTVFDNAHLTWLQPGSIADEWIHWDNGMHSGNLGYGQIAYTFSVASRWPVEDIAPYDGGYLKKIMLFPGAATCSYTLKVWTGENANTLVLSQPLSNLNINSWNEIALASPVLIDGSQELWFGYEAAQTEGYPAGLSTGPAVAGKGDMFNGGGGWFSMKQAWNYDYNWLLRGFVSESASPSAPAIPMHMTSSESPAISAVVIPELKPQIFFPDAPFKLTLPSGSQLNPRAGQLFAGKTSLNPTLTLTGYNVYKDSVMIASNIQDTYFDDAGLPKGRYQYEVAAQYDLGESARIGPVNVDIYTCFPPLSIQVPGDSLTRTSALITWVPSPLSNSTQWLLEFGYSGFQRGTGILIQVNDSAFYRLNGLNPWSEYDVYLSTVCSGNDTSAWVMKRFRTHYLECDPSDFSENESCGDTINNGCSLTVPMVDSIDCSETICGSVWLSGQTSDVDYYAFSLPDTTDVTFFASAEFSFFMGIKSAPCPANGFIVSSYGWIGGNFSLAVQLAPGNYYFYFAPTFNGPVACDSLNRYQINMYCNSCLTPKQLAATNLTYNSASLSWYSSASLWDLEYGGIGFTPGYGERITGLTENSYQLTGLTSGMTYSFYVRSDCGDGETSNWAGPYSFFLPCEPTSLPYYEDFYEDGTGFSPQCWEIRGAGATTNWYVEYDNMAGGDYPELKFDPYSPGFYGTQYLVSPMINTTGQTELNLSFNHYRQLSSMYTNFEIMTTSDGGATWNSVWWDNQTGIYGPETTYINISNSDVGSAEFQFAFVVNGDSYQVTDWHIDNILLEGTTWPGTLEGNVQTCNGGNPIDGALVTAGVYTTTTGADGHYQFSSIPAGIYNITFFKEGYDSVVISGLEVFSGTISYADACLELSAPPANDTIRNVQLLSGQSLCYDATQTITVAGSGTTFIVNTGASASFIAGQRIRFLPGTRVFAGGYMVGRIAPSGPWCNAKSAIANAEPEVDTPIPAAGIMGDGLTLYPNPASGLVTIKLPSSSHPGGALYIQVFGLQGNLVLSQQLPFNTLNRFDVGALPAGIYFVSAQHNGLIYRGKLVKTD